jgi:hypothetical protein
MKRVRVRSRSLEVEPLEGRRLPAVPAIPLDTDSDFQPAQNRTAVVEPATVANDRAASRNGSRFSGGRARAELGSNGEPARDLDRSEDEAKENQIDSDREHLRFLAPKSPALVLLDAASDAEDNASTSINTTTDVLASSLLQRTLPRVGNAPIPLAGFSELAATAPATLYLLDPPDEPPNIQGPAEPPEVPSPGTDILPDLPAPGVPVAGLVGIDLGSIERTAQQFAVRLVNLHATDDGENSLESLIWLTGSALLLAGCGWSAEAARRDRSARAEANRQFFHGSFPSCDSSLFRSDV